MELLSLCLPSLKSSFNLVRGYVELCDEDDFVVVACASIW